MSNLEFDDIRPYEPDEMKEAFDALLTDRHFNAVMKGLVPWLPKTVRNGVLRLAFTGVKTPLGFQKRFMKPVVKHIIRKHTDGCTFNDEALPADKGLRYTFISNHRDIVLDSALLDVMLIEAGYPTTVEIGIGDNLLIYPWIEHLVRMNKAFIVRRGLSLRETLAASQKMSRYIHYAVTQKRENIWLAQREGRAKDSSDHTQDAVLKMLAMGGSPTPQLPNSSTPLSPLNIVPLTISYEYDPCDYLKAQEFQQKRDDPAFKKSRQDDLDNMRTGIFGYKGRVHYHCGTPLNLWIDELADLPKTEFYTALAHRIDRELHRHYRLYPSNYAAARLSGHDAEAAECARLLCLDDTAARQAVTQFEAYLSQQVAKVSLPQKDEAFLRECLLTMYANPLLNHLAAL